MVALGVTLWCVFVLSMVARAERWQVSLCFEVTRRFDGRSTVRSAALRPSDAMVRNMMLWCISKERLTMLRSDTMLAKCRVDWCDGGYLRSDAMLAMGCDACEALYVSSDAGSIYIRRDAKE